MFTRTIIAAAIAGAFAWPLAVNAADYGSKSSSSANPSTSTRGGSQADGSNTSQSDIANTPGRPGSSSPSANASGSRDESERGAISAKEFAKLDKDHDGSLTKDEVKLHPVLRSRFNSLDKDHDGKLSQAEATGGAIVGSSESRTRISRNDRGTTGSSSSSVNPSGSTRGADNTAVTGSAGTSGAANVTQSDVANTPGTPGSSSPTR